jgi:predicted DCC family thiol-disulfide oxidoreductase YuxK
MKYSKKFLSLVFIIGLLCACNQPTKTTNKILEQLHQFKGFEISKNTKAVVIIADNSCMTCNRQLALLMTNYLKDPNIKFVVAAHESGMDLSDYLHASRKDIVFDRNHQLTDQEIIKGSTVLFLNNGDVDTTIQIEASLLEQQLQYLRQRL